MAERTSDFLRVMNLEISEALKNWKYSPHFAEYEAALNTILRLADKTGLSSVLKVTDEAMARNLKDSNRILLRIAAAPGEQEESWVFSIPPGTRNPDYDAYFLRASSAGEEDELIYGQMNHGIVARFTPSDVISITLQ